MLHEEMDRYIMNGWTDTCRLINSTFLQWMDRWMDKWMNVTTLNG